MSLNAKEVKGGGKTYPAMEPGAYPARVVQIIDCGLQPQEFKGEAKTPKTEVGITYEFLDEFLPDDDGNPNEEKPRWLSEFIPLNNLQSEKAKSTQRYYALDPSEEHDGDFTKLINTPCIVTIVKKPSGKDKIERNYISSVSSMREKDAAKAEKLVNDPKLFVLEEPDMEIFLSLPEWLQNKIKNNLEFEGSKLDDLLENYEKSEKKNKKEEVEDDIPHEYPSENEEENDEEDW